VPSLPLRFAAVARRQPQAPALGWQNVRWSYAELLNAIEAAAQHFSTLGIQRGARIALLARNSPHYVALYYAALAAGYVAVPLNAQERASVLARQIEHCEAALVVGDPGHPEWVTLRAVTKARICEVPLHTEPDALERFLESVGNARSELAHHPEPDELAAIIYTSGTTGRPKGVMLSHRNLLQNTQSIIEYLAITPADRGLCVLPFHFSYGSSVLHTHLLAGAYLAIEDNFAFPHIVLQRLQSESITGFFGVPSTFALLLGRCRLADADLSRLRYITQAGGPMPRALIENLRSQIPHAQLFIMYGQTEATARLSYLPPDRLGDKLGSIGIAIPGVTLEVRKDGKRAEPHVTGELVARGPNVMLGYWNDPAATETVLRDGWLHTGDLAHTDDDGFFYIDGRATDMIKVGAFRVSPQEVEEVITALENVQEAAVVGIPDDTLGQAIKAVIVPKPGVTLEALAVKAHCRQHLAAYKVPKLVEFTTVLPRTASGKIQRYRLTDAASAYAALSQ
jgi:long-chain acyl-CoA synthetase